MNIQQWEYLVATDDGTFSTKIDGVRYAGGISEFLNIKGKEGWQLCAVVQNTYYYFKRPLNHQP